MATEIGDEAARPVLVLCGPALYDTLVTVPALRALRRAHPGRPLVLAGGPAALLLRAAGVVDGVVATTSLEDDPPGLRLPGLGDRVPHTAVNLHGPGPGSHRLLLAGRPDDVLWFACTPPPGAPDPGWGLDSGPLWDDDEHDVDRWCRLVAGAGATPDPQDLLLDVAPAARAADVVVDPGTAVEAALVARGHTVAVLPEDPRDRAATVRAARVVVARAGSGLAALAVATGTPSVVLPGQRAAARCGPRRDTDRHVVLGATPTGPDDVAALAAELAERTRLPDPG
jgi:hypothetical protein